MTSVAQQVVSGSSSRNSVGVLDVLEDSAYEDGFGNVYSFEKDVSDAINSILGTLITANTQNTQGGLLETFAIKNTIVNGQDLGGRLTKQQLLAEISAAGIAFGLKPDAFSMQLQQSVVQSPNNTDYFGVAVLSSGPLPTSVNLFQSNPACVPPTINQGNCENCWAIGSSFSLSYNLCAASGVPVTSSLSVQHITGCAQTVGNNGCAPQPPSTMFTFGLGDIHTTLCMPQIPTGTQAIGCPTSCQNTVGSLSVVNGVEPGTYTVLQGSATIKRYLASGMAVATAITVASDFLQVFPLNSPSNAIYNPSSIAYPLLGGHMIWIYGYADDVPVPYWNVRNSWGSIQGEGGNLKIAQNIKAYVNVTMWIETNTYVATPRTGSISPPQPIQLIPGNASSEVIPTSTVYTNTYGCPNLILNQLQSKNATATNTCPSNTAVKNTQKRKAASEAHAAHVNQKSDGNHLRPTAFAVILIMVGMMTTLIS